MTGAPAQVWCAASAPVAGTEPALSKWAPARGLPSYRPKQGGRNDADDSRVARPPSPGGPVSSWPSVPRGPVSSWPSGPTSPLQIPVHTLTLRSGQPGLSNPDLAGDADGRVPRRCTASSQIPDDAEIPRAVGRAAPTASRHLPPTRRPNRAPGRCARGRAPTQPAPA
jgi:hypothetical protein